MARELIVVKWTYEPVHDDAADIIDLLARGGETFSNDWVEAADKIRDEDDRISLNELKHQSRVGPLVLDDIDAGDEANWIMTIKFDTDAPNELQGDSLTTAITFSLEQTVDQD